MSRTDTRAILAVALFASGEGCTPAGEGAQRHALIGGRCLCVPSPQDSRSFLPYSESPSMEKTEC